MVGNATQVTANLAPVSGRCIGSIRGIDWEWRVEISDGCCCPVIGNIRWKWRIIGKETDGRWRGRRTGQEIKGHRWRRCRRWEKWCGAGRRRHGRRRRRRHRRTDAIQSATDRRHSAPHPQVFTRRRRWRVVPLVRRVEFRNHVWQQTFLN